MYQLKIQKNINKVKEYPTYDENGNELNPEVTKTAQEIEDEKQALIDAKTAKIKAKVNKYKAAQEYQRKHGGAGPVADFDTMKIVNEHNGQFEVVFE